MKYYGFGCGMVVTGAIGLLGTIVILWLTMPVIRAMGIDAGKLIFLAVGILGWIATVYCYRKDLNTVIEIKTWWWEFLGAVSFWIALSFTILYFKAGEFLDKNGQVKTEERASDREV